MRDARDGKEVEKSIEERDLNKFMFFFSRMLHPGAPLNTPYRFILTILMSYCSDSGSV